MSSVFVDVKRDVKLSEVVSRYVELTPSGHGHYRSCCPIHGGDNPSGFSVNDNSGLWYCHSGSCGGGSVIDFALKIGMATDAYHAAVALAEEAGIEVPEDSQEVTDKTRIQAVDLVCSMACQQLVDAFSDSSNVVVEYALSRGIDKGVVEDWMLGFIYDESSIVKKLRDRGLSSAAEDVGILSYSFGSPSIRSSGRFMMPVMNSNGKAVGWSARIVDGVVPRYVSKAKYINSSDSSIYSKKGMLYGQNFLHSGVSHVVVVEGNVDAIMVNYFFDVWGLDDYACVAVCGSTLTKQQLSVILDSCPRMERLLLAFDNDSGGLKALKGCHWAMDYDALEGVEIVVPGAIVDSFLGEKLDQADIISGIVLSGSKDFSDYYDSMFVDVVPLFDALVEAVALEPVGSAGWIRSVWGDFSRSTRQDFVDAVAVRVSPGDPSSFVDEVGAYVPRVNLKSSRELSGFVAPLTRELLALPYGIRDMVIRRLVPDEDFCRALNLSSSDVDFINSLIDVKVAGDGTSDARVAQFVSDFISGDIRWTVVPAVARWISHNWDSSFYDVASIKRIGNCNEVPCGDVSWLWLCSLFGE